jgi:cyclopropane fatty-acyl-phospholipid synthase-like methyltransferase
MQKKYDINHYLNSIVNRGYYSSKRNLHFQMKTLFKGVDLNNKMVLDIGGGVGICSFYAAFKGAKKVICLEPQADGSSSKVIEKFRDLENLMNVDNVKLETKTLEELESRKEIFDVILLNNSVNHLHEASCINLQTDIASKNIYCKIFRKIYSLSAKKAKLIICDCSRYNFFAFLKIQNPFLPTIEWHKHQAPKEWIKLLTDVGFVNPRIHWSSFNTLRYWGKLILGNKYMSYFLTSHFCLKMEKLST